MQVYVLYEPNKYFSNAKVKYNTLKNIKIGIRKKEKNSLRKNKEDSKRNETSANLSLPEHQSIKFWPWPRGHSQVNVCLRLNEEDPCPLTNSAVHGGRKEKGGKV